MPKNNRKRKRLKLNSVREECMFMSLREFIVRYGLKNVQRVMETAINDLKMCGELPKEDDKTIQTEDKQML